METAWEFWVACRDFDLEKVEKMLGQGVDPNVRAARDFFERGVPEYGYPVLYAAAAGRVDLLTLLHRAGANLEVTEAHKLRWCPPHTTALLIAIFFGHDDVFDWLIDHGADPLAISAGDGLSILDLAIFKNNTRVFNWLADNPILDVLKDRILSQGENLYHSAANQSDPDMVNRVALYCGGLDINKEDFQGRTPLMIAIQRKNMETLKALVELGADLDYHNDRFETALSKAVLCERREMIAFLLSQGASPNALDFRNPAGVHYLTLAYRQGNIPLVRELRNRGAGRTFRVEEREEIISLIGSSAWEKSLRLV